MSAQKPEILWTKEELWEISRERTETVERLQALNAELLEALEAAKATLERECGVNPGEGVGGVFVKINAAISKARN